MNGNELHIARFQIWLVSLSPTKGSEITKTRPCIIISPDVMNKNLNTVIVAPLTHSLKNYPTRLDIMFNQQQSQIALDQIRTIDKNERLIQKLGLISKSTSILLTEKLLEMFRY